jgi:hypothetical protein
MVGSSFAAHCTTKWGLGVRDWGLVKKRMGSESAISKKEESLRLFVLADGCFA